MHSFTPGRIGYASGKLPKNRHVGDYSRKSRPASGKPHWHRHFDVKRPTLTCDSRRVVRSQSAVWRLFAQVDFRREMAPNTIRRPWDVSRYLSSYCFRFAPAYLDPLRAGTL